MDCRTAAAAPLLFKERRPESGEKERVEPLQKEVKGGRKRALILGSRMIRRAPAGRERKRRTRTGRRGRLLARVEFFDLFVLGFLTLCCFVLFCSDHLSTVNKRKLAVRWTGTGTTSCLQPVSFSKQQRKENNRREQNNTQFEKARKAN